MASGVRKAANVGSGRLTVMGSFPERQLFSANPAKPPIPSAIPNKKEAPDLGPEPLRPPLGGMGGYWNLARRLTPK